MDERWPYAVALVVGDAASGPVDRQLGEVRAAEPDELGVDVRELPRLEQRVIGEVDARHHVAVWKATCSVSAKKLSGLRLSIILPDRPHRTSSSGMSLVGVEQVEVELLVLLLDDLHAQLPLGVVAALDRLQQVAAVEVRILAARSSAPRPRRSECTPATGFQWNFTKRRLALGIDETEGVNAEALHHPEAARDGAVLHQPHQHVRALRLQRHEVPERVVGRRRLRDLVVAAPASPHGRSRGT